MASANWSASPPKGPATRPDIKLGICGEHGGDPASIHFCEEVGLDYVSCSPFRVPIARLAAAQAARSFARQRAVLCRTNLLSYLSMKSRTALLYPSGSCSMAK
jgi:phosphoenolpyruvate-protein kinase (PTS system EI component)